MGCAEGREASSSLRLQESIVYVSGFCLVTRDACRAQAGGPSNSTRTRLVAGTGMPVRGLHGRVSDRCLGRGGPGTAEFGYRIRVRTGSRKPNHPGRARACIEKVGDASMGLKPMGARF